MALSPVARPYYAAHIRAVRSELPGGRDCAARDPWPEALRLPGLGEGDARSERVGEGIREPSEAVQRRLRLALQVAGAIAEVDSAEIARAWFQGLNPQLGDRSPARLLREGDLDEVGPEVIGAERAFLVGG